MKDIGVLQSVDEQDAKKELLAIYESLIADNVVLDAIQESNEIEELKGILFFLRGIQSVARETSSYSSWSIIAGELDTLANKIRLEK